MANVVLRFDSVEEYIGEQYIKNCHYLGVIIGRTYNQISKDKYPYYKKVRDYLVVVRFTIYNLRVNH